MKVLIVGDAVDVRDVVLEALQGDGECLTASHKEGKEICLLQRPDIVVVCDYDEISPMACGIGFQSYCRIREIMPEDRMIRFGEKAFKYENYCKTKVSLQAAVYLHHRKRGGAIFSAGRARRH